MTALEKQDLITLAKTFSRYFCRITDASPQKIGYLSEKLEHPFNFHEILDTLNNTSIHDEISLNHTLRQLRQDLMLHLIARDLGKFANLSEITATMSSFAEIVIHCALKYHTTWLAQQFGQAIGNETGYPQQLIVVGMGKLGGAELNVSSDIDLIFVYPEEGETTGPSIISNQEFFERLGRKLISTLNDLTSDGFVFRVDMRLRPYGESGSLVCSFAMLEEYLITQGREWERYAWIKARPLSGDRQDELLKLFRPFVFRKYLDFGAYESMRQLHAQIRQEVKRRDMNNNIKLGPGGIREIEFIAQVFQLIRGGREQKFQIRPTLNVLTELQNHQLLSSEVIDSLKQAYTFLRNLEHRIQYLDDQQTHNLPTNPEDQQKIAVSLGYSNYQLFLKQLDHYRTLVSQQFGEIFSNKNEEQHPLANFWLNQIDDETALSQLKHFSNPQEILHRLQQTKKSLCYRNLPTRNRERFDKLIPQLIELSQSADHPDSVLTRTVNLLETISGRAAYLELLHQYPQTLEKITHLVGASAWAAEYLTHHPVLLDELLAAQTDAAPDWHEFKTILETQLSTYTSDIERQMDILREAHHTQLFRLLLQDLAGKLQLEKLSDHLSALADLILEVTLALCWQYLTYKHRTEPKFAIIAYGKLGGKELGYASDLDLIFLYDDAASDAPEIYARLSQRINTWLTSLTAAGTLFETDLRLRPNGQSGLLVSAIDSFHEYQLNDAWVWEHQALTRARFCAGDKAIGERFENIRCEILRQKRDLSDLRTEVVNMRQKMLDAHSKKSNLLDPFQNRSERASDGGGRRTETGTYTKVREDFEHRPTSDHDRVAGLGRGLFDIKHDRGGLIDIEFIVQYLVLAYSHQYKQLTGNKGNIALLKMTADLQLIPQDLAEIVRNGYREYRRIQHQQRLEGVQFVRVPHEQIKPIKDAVLKLWRLVFDIT